MRIRPRTFARAFVLVILSTACGSDDSGPAGPGEPTIPSIVGNYSGTWNNRVTVPSTGERVQVFCPATVSITNQGPDGGFTGTWTQGTNGDCDAGSGSLAGSVAAGGAMSVTQFTNANALTIEEATGGQCTFTSGANAFAGTANGSIFEMTTTAVADCLGTTVNFSWTLSASR